MCFVISSFNSPRSYIMVTKAQRIAAEQDVKTQQARRSNADVLKALRGNMKATLAGQQPAEPEVTVDDFEVPDSRRMLVGTVLGLVAGVTSFSAVSTLTSWLIATAWIASASVFLSTTIYILGIILAVYAGLKAASTVFGYVISEKDKEHGAMLRGQFLRSREKIASMWNRNDVVEA